MENSMRKSAVTSITEHEAQRQEIARQIDVFLKKGGKIDCLKQPQLNVRPLGAVATPLLPGYM
jgi:hypothetical protein